MMGFDKKELKKQCLYLQIFKDENFVVNYLLFPDHPRKYSQIQKEISLQLILKTNMKAKTFLNNEFVQIKARFGSYESFN